MASLNRTAWSLLAALILVFDACPSSFAAGSVAMQVENLVQQAIADTAATEEATPRLLVKYFASNAKYEVAAGPLLGAEQIARQIDAEFKAYKARFQVTRMFVQENQAAIVMTWDAVDRKSGEEPGSTWSACSSWGPAASSAPRFSTSIPRRPRRWQIVQ